MSLMTIEQDGQKRRTSRSFFRGESINFHPTSDSLQRQDVIDEYIMKGWNPKERFVDSDTPMVAFGSCFASNISNYLHDRGYNILTKKENKAYVTQMGDGMVNTYAILQQFEWAWLNKQPSADLWQGYQAEEFGYDEEVRLDTKALFDEAEVFIITLGLSEIWYDEPTGEVFWRAVPAEKYDATRHKFRVATVAETKANLLRIRKLIREFRPDASILFSVSPIPLTATFRPVSCLSANSVSKAVLRAAFDEFYRDVSSYDKNLFYFPSYETVMHVYNNQWHPDRRHVHKSVLDFNMKMFEHYYCIDGLNKDELIEAYETSKAVDSVAKVIKPKPTLEEKIAAKKAARVQSRIDERKEKRKMMRGSGVFADVSSDEVQSSVKE